MFKAKKMFDAKRATGVPTGVRWDIPNTSGLVFTGNEVIPVETLKTTETRLTTGDVTISQYYGMDKKVWERAIMAPDAMAKVLAQQKQVLTNAIFDPPPKRGREVIHQNDVCAHYIDYDSNCDVKEYRNMGYVDKHSINRLTGERKHERFPDYSDRARAPYFPTGDRYMTASEVMERQRKAFGFTVR